MSGSCRACIRDRARPDHREVCERVFRGRTGWWERPLGYQAELTRALRRTPLPRYPKRWTLPRPTLAGEARRLAGAELSDPTGKTFEGPEAAVEWVRFRRQQLGL